MSGTMASSRALNQSWGGSGVPPPLVSPRRPSQDAEAPGHSGLAQPLHISTTSAHYSVSTTHSGSPASATTEEGPGSFHRMDSHGGSSLRDSPDRVSTDTETKNLLDDGFSEGDAQSIADGEDPYQMTPEQRLYYTEHFKTLLQATAQKIDTKEGAIRGSDDKVKEFFQKSSLSQESLCKIWQLADVNQDGWLNLEEFSLAMHLIVLHVKGNLLIPEFLPPHIAPRVTPPRSEHPNQPGWTNFESGERSAESSVDSEDPAGVPPSPHSQMFTTQPPPVEKPIAQHRRRPSESPESDPPATTPRDAPDGGVFPVAHHTYGNAPTPPRRRALPAHSDGPVPAITKSKTASLPLSPPSALVQSAPKGPPPKPPPRPPHKSHGRSASLDLSKGGLPGVPGNAVEESGESKEPPSDPLPPPPLKDEETQTGHGDVADVGWSRERHSPPPMMDLEEEEAERDEGAPSARGEEPDTYQGRVAKLRKANAELDKERSRLAQLRLGLELKLNQLHS